MASGKAAAAIIKAKHRKDAKATALDVSLNENYGSMFKTGATDVEAAVDEMLGGVNEWILNNKGFADPDYHIPADVAKKHSGYYVISRVNNWTVKENLEVIDPWK